MGRIYQRDSSQIARLRFLQFVVFFMFVALIITVFRRQIVAYNIYSHLNAKQCMRRILHSGMRGQIFDRNGVLLAGNKLNYKLCANLNIFRGALAKFSRENVDVSDCEEEQLWALVSDAVRPYLKFINYDELKISPKELYLHYKQKILLPVDLINSLSVEEYAILSEKLPLNSPFYVVAENVRYYPFGASACHVIGYVAKVNSSDEANIPGSDLRTFFLPKQEGKAGVEAYYNDILSGMNGGDICMVTPSGQVNKRLINIPSSNGQNLNLTLDINLQQACEKALGNNDGVVIILKVDTGEVLAMVSKPDFDLNDLCPKISKAVFDKITDDGGWLNKCTQGLYPPGSAFKLVVASALLKNNTITSNSIFDCTGSLKIGNRNFHCHNRYGHGEVNLVKAIKFSCNTFFYNYAIKAGPKIISDEAKLFNFDQPTAIDLPFESKNMLVPSPEWKYKKLYEKWTDGDTANLSIGQGFLRITPLQMASFMASLARNSTKTIPFVNLDSKKIQLTTSAISQNNFNTLISDMEAMAENWKYMYKEKPIAMKTSTAQVKISGQNAFKHVGWAVGFAPSKSPEIAFVVLVEQKDLSSKFWGGQVCGPILLEILILLRKIAIK